jgi:hypothetical protein
LTPITSAFEHWRDPIRKISLGRPQEFFSSKTLRFDHNVPKQPATLEIERRPEMKQSSITRDGFRVLRDQFIVPRNASTLDTGTKRAVTICNLFLNHRLSLSDIVRVLDEDNGRVVLALLEQGIIEDRRHLPRVAPKESERRKFGLATERR